MLKGSIGNSATNDYPISRGSLIILEENKWQIKSIEFGQK